MTMQKQFKDVPCNTDDVDDLKKTEQKIKNFKNQERIIIILNEFWGDKYLHLSYVMYGISLIFSQSINSVSFAGGTNV